MEKTTGFNSLFGPLEKKYCYYFYILSLVGIIALILWVVSFAVIAVSKKNDSRFYISSFFIAVIYGTLYLQNRLLFNMCSHSL